MAEQQREEEMAETEAEEEEEEVWLVTALCSPSAAHHAPLRKRVSFVGLHSHQHSGSVRPPGSRSGAQSAEDACSSSTSHG